MKTIYFEDNKVKYIDQTLLPEEYKIVSCTDVKELEVAIKTLAIRGAPAIGVAGAYGIVLAALSYNGNNKEEFFNIISDGEKIKNARPTAVNLMWAVERMMGVFQKIKNLSIEDIKKELILEAERIRKEDAEVNRKMGQYGHPLISTGDGVLTHCNAGALATSEYGTALGVIRAAVEAGKKIRVYSDETRPLLQGARLTTWELKEDGIPVTLICDNMAGISMRRGLIQKVIVGADRIAMNGDVANKIGTYQVAVLAKENNIPFYVAAPISTFDPKAKTGEDIPIEERNKNEVTHIGGVRIATEGIDVFNPAFDVTPANYISGIITEKGVLEPPYEKSIKQLFIV
ncbi:MAG: S-methyl-5-thioribose-1-phosphate isomerase [Candidatus Methanofastidiosa archaeon]|nr:S-methyl-5-thioribose-1-phosphate isomerase [Candidatus Methanofastidiosa archaeon]